jgi:hypothetical protein
MFTSIDKALVAAIMGGLFFVQTYTGLQLPWATPDTIATIIGLVTPVLVWANPGDHRKPFARYSAPCGRASRTASPPEPTPRPGTRPRRHLE